VVATKVDEKTLKKEGVCAASLPTTMGIVAGLLVQNALKYLLKFGEVSNYVGYNALEDFFPSMTLKPNVNCDDYKCVKKQEEYAKYILEHPEVLQVEEVVETEVVHEDNDWGISLVESESSEGTEEPAGRDLNLVAGLKVAYSIPEQPMRNTQEDCTVDDDGGESLDELMSRMKNI